MSYESTNSAGGNPVMIHMEVLVNFLFLGTIGDLNRFLVRKIFELWFLQN